MTKRSRTPTGDKRKDTRPDRDEFRATAVATLMSRPPITIGLDASLTAALSAFAAYGVRHLVVVDGVGRCKGVLTDRAVAAHWACHPLAFDRFTVSAVFSADVRCVRPETPLVHAARAMRAAGIDAVVVAGEADEPVGIVTATDLIEAVAGRVRSSAAIDTDAGTKP